MASSRSTPVAVTFVASVFIWATHFYNRMELVPSAMVPSPVIALRNRWSPCQTEPNPEWAVQGAYAAAIAAAARAPMPSYAVQEDNQGFSVRILLVLAVPMLAVSWALATMLRSVVWQVGRGHDILGGRPRAVRLQRWVAVMTGRVARPRAV